MFGLTNLKLAIAGGMVLLIVILGATSAVLWSRLDAKDAQITTLRQQLGMAAADAQRWETAVEGRQRIIDRQALTLRRLESDGQAARAIAAQQRDQAQQRIEALEAKVSKLKEAARARPEDVRDLGPIVRDALQSGAVGGLQH
jgi:multidrug resistance efflux pump